jgi:hypothetical protein
MLTTLTDFDSYVAAALPAVHLLLAQTSGGGGPSPPIQWAIVGFAVAAGLLLTLSPSRRTYEVKRPKED